MTIQYHKSGDYYLPNLVFEDTEVQPIGKYGRMRKCYLKEHRPVLYSNLLLSGKLVEHLAEIDGVCEERMELLTRQMTKQEGVTEALKATDQMEWVRRMNSIRSRGAPHEQHPQSGGGDRAERTRILLMEVSRC